MFEEYWGFDWWNETYFNKRHAWYNTNTHIDNTCIISKTYWNVLQVNVSPSFQRRRVTWLQNYRRVRLQAALHMPSKYRESGKRAMRSNGSLGTLMSYTDHSIQRRLKSNAPNVTTERITESFYWIESQRVGLSMGAFKCCFLFPLRMIVFKCEQLWKKEYIL